MAYEIFTLEDKEKWKKVIRDSEFYDFYHTWVYHSLEKNGIPKLFLYSEGETWIALPLLTRSIFDTGYLDITSAYGYVGPISNYQFEDLPNVFLNNFKDAFLEYLESEKIVSVFSRLHPFMNQEILLNKFCCLHSNGKTVVINLKTSLEEQRAKYRKTLKEKINQLRRKGFYTKEVNDLESVRKFVSIYSENMARIGATDEYLFDEAYFVNLLNSDEIHCKLILVYIDEEAVCGSLITCTNQIIQGHLIGTKEDYLKDSPAKLLVDEISLIGRDNDMKYYHLGGGVGGNDDSLFNWKAGFSDEFLDFKTWRFIANKNAYKDLVDSKNLADENNQQFFPLYRLHDNQLKTS
ncbi:GNAT family N-acetyltransferase [Daejeonella oryzae]|uniref:GNAT family N-acetyltransferase n=1 Tax=Daejeonella oryzae TaxID=1122943 RepID=UPI00041F86F6|nr:GNAT family N-acetyltransferase [Daejeonella oryzae]